MTSTNVTESVAAAASDVWQIMSDFGGLEPNEMIAGCTLEGDGVGAVRTISLVAGGEVIERLESQDDTALTFSYAIINDSPLPVKNYLAKVEVSDSGDGSTTVSWSSTFEPSGAPENDVIELIQGIYKGGIQRVRDKLGA